ncbi:MAG TPA: HAD family hydrolase [Stenotrophomonas sp.]|jgi:hypothetical protein
MNKPLAAIVLWLCLWASPVLAQDPLPSWNDGPAKQAIVTFVDAATTRDGKGFIPVDERFATFDNDGTLWAEQPLYFQVFFVMDRVRALAAHHPEWKTTEPFKSVLAGDMKGLAATGEKGLVELMTATHTGMTTDEFSAIVRDWVRTARHPVTHQPYTSMVYQPMLELLAYLRANQFKTYIVSGGGQEFMRPWTEQVYGIPPEQVIGSHGELEYRVTDDGPALMKLPAVALVDDGPGKPVGIQRFIGRRPALAFGNSDGDQQMLEWTAHGDGPRFAGLVHHTDGKREWAYDRQSHIGKLDKALDQAARDGWTVVDMARDWKQIYPDTP